MRPFATGETGQDTVRRLRDPAPKRADRVVAQAARTFGLNLPPALP